MPQWFNFLIHQIPEHDFIKDTSATTKKESAYKFAGWMELQSVPYNGQYFIILRPHPFSEYELEYVSSSNWGGLEIIKYCMW